MRPDSNYSRQPHDRSRPPEGFDNTRLPSNHRPSKNPLERYRGTGTSHQGIDPHHYYYPQGPVPPRGGGPNLATAIQIVIFGATITLLCLKTAPKLLNNVHNPQPTPTEQKSGGTAAAQEQTGKLIVKNSGKKDDQGATLYSAEYVIGGKSRKLGDFICGAPNTDGADRLKAGTGACNPKGIYSVAEIETTDRDYRQGEVIGYEPDDNVGTSRTGFAIGYGTGSRGGLTCTKQEDADFLLKEAKEQRFKLVEVKD